MLCFSSSSSLFSFFFSSSCIFLGVSDLPQREASCYRLVFITFLFYNISKRSSSLSRIALSGLPMEVVASIPGSFFKKQG